MVTDVIGWLHRLVDVVVVHPTERERLHEELERVSNPVLPREAAPPTQEES